MLQSIGVEIVPTDNITPYGPKRDYLQEAEDIILSTGINVITEEEMVIILKHRAKVEDLTLYGEKWQADICEFNPCPVTKESAKKAMELC